jgi:CheY-like chemotaxis protein
MAALKILLIDDEPESSEFLHTELSQRGFEVSCADSIEGALAFLEAKAFDGIILDVELSRAQRGRLMGALVDKQQLRPPLLVLASPSVLSREEAYGWGASAVMSKPLNIDAIIQRLAQLAVPIAQRRPKGPRPVVSVGNGRLIKGLVPQQFLGRGGAVVPVDSMEGGATFLEGSEVRFELTVQGSEDQPIRGQGVVRYVSVDASAGVPRAWGIEFSSFEDSDDSAAGVPLPLRTAATSTSYIPRIVH